MAHPWRIAGALLAVVAAGALTFTGTGVRHAVTRWVPAPRAH
ncbi:hypothetical protein ABT174_15430 [Streptomyces sparsogenes]